MILETGWTGLLLLGAAWDMKTGRIPNAVNLALLSVSLAEIMLNLVPAAAEAELWRLLLYVLVRHGGAAGLLSLPMLAADLVRPGAFGGGDIKYAFAGGWILTFSQAADAMAVAFALGSIAALLRLGQKRKGRLRFGPCLAAGLLGVFWVGRLGSGGF